MVNIFPIFHFVKIFLKTPASHQTSHIEPLQPVGQTGKIKGQDHFDFQIFQNIQTFIPLPLLSIDSARPILPQKDSNFSWKKTAGRSPANFSKRSSYSDSFPFSGTAVPKKTTSARALSSCLICMTVLSSGLTITRISKRWCQRFCPLHVRSPDSYRTTHNPRQFRLLQVAQFWFFDLAVLDVIFFSQHAYH